MRSRRRRIERLTQRASLVSPIFMAARRMPGGTIKMTDVREYYQHALSERGFAADAAQHKGAWLKIIHIISIPISKTRVFNIELPQE